jgi:hypothetical protein
MQEAFSDEVLLKLRSSDRKVAMSESEEYFR